MHIAEQADEVVRGALGHGRQFRNAVLAADLRLHVVQDQLQRRAVQAVGEAAAVLLLRQPAQLGAEQDQEQLPGNQLDAVRIGHLAGEDVEQLLEGLAAQHGEALFLPLARRLLQRAEQRLGEGAFEVQGGEAEGLVGLEMLNRGQA